ncbi:CHAP domain [Chlamydia trachomatis]|nr:CHAP domain [Chlamydia trachomatis]
MTKKEGIPLKEVSLKRISSCVLVGTMILSGFSQVVLADENRMYTDHQTYYIGRVEYNLDGSLVNQAEHVCDFVFPEPEQPEVPAEPEQPEQPEQPDQPEQPEQPSKPDEEKPDDSQTKDDKEEIRDNTTEQKPDSQVQNPVTPAPSTFNYVANTWYHPTTLNALGYTGEVHNAIKLDNFLTGNWSKFVVSGNPFSMPQCTYFAWSRFYQVYGFDSGARGNGKTNAMEIVQAHPDQFQLSSTPAGGAVFSCELNTLYPEYGHVGFVEAYDGQNVWLSEGNYRVGNTDGNIYIHKMSWDSFKAQYPDVVFAVPKQGTIQTSKEASVTIDNKDAIELYNKMNGNVVAKKNILRDYQK